MIKSIVARSVILSLLLFGCTLGPASILAPEKPTNESFTDEIKAETNRLAESRRKLKEAVQKETPRKIDVKPVMPVYDPLEDRLVSFSMIDEDLQTILYALSKSVGINLIIDPGVTLTDKKLTLSFEEASASAVLNEILTMFDLYYQIDRNIIRVKPFQQKMFHLNFLDTTMDTDFVVGGDVLGAIGEDAITGLSGAFKLLGKGSAKGKTNAFDMIEQMVQKSLSGGGSYSMNRLSGSLIVNDTPERIRSIAKVIHHAKEMMSRQILIEARIIEVILENEHKYGIDWEVFISGLNSEEKDNATLTYLLENGLSIEGVIGRFDFNATIDALNTFGDIKIVSNPMVRTKHGMPAVISVGTSISYTKSQQTTIVGGGSDALTTSQVDVSKLFDGLILGLIPFIEESGRITLLVNPVLSNVDRSSLELVDVGADVSISLPEVNIRELNSTIALNDGDTVIFGGLIDSIKSIEDKGFPFFSAIPVFGYLFKSEFSNLINRELVLILNVTII